jgi:protein-S-isoprenylcysteine O-methyltransferase Ste14
MVAALLLSYRSHADLGQNWSVTLELRAGHQLIRHGVYRSIRHPMYASIRLWCLAQGCCWKTGWPDGMLYRRLRSCILSARLARNE